MRKDGPGGPKLTGAVFFCWVGAAGRGPRGLGGTSFVRVIETNKVSPLVGPGAVGLGVRQLK